MSLHDLIVSDVSDVFLVTDDFAEVVTRYAKGDRDVRSSVTGVVTYQPTDMLTTRGKGYRRTATLAISSDVVVDAADAFLLGSDRYEVVAIDAPQDGMRTVHLQQYEGEAKGLRRAGEI
jgi:hypothetical protein